jgi:hypothetical protein
MATLSCRPSAPTLVGAGAGTTTPCPLLVLASIDARESATADCSKVW